MSQLNIVLGILVATLSNYFVARVLGEDHPSTWRWMFGVMTVPALAFLCTALLIPESPRWLVKRGRREEAERSWCASATPTPRSRAMRSRNRMEAERTGQGHGFRDLVAVALLAQVLALLVIGKVNFSFIMLGVALLLLGFGKLVWNFPRQYLKPLLLACMIGAFNQLDGINAVLYYAPSIFRMAGADKAGALMQAVIIGLTNLVMTLVAMALIDRVGRKALLLVGSVTFVMSHVLAAWVFATHAQGWIVLVAMMGVVGSHAYSQGAVVWVIINRSCCPTPCAPPARRLSASSSGCFAGSPLLPGGGGESGAYAFGFFALMMVVQFFAY